MAAPSTLPWRRPRREWLVLALVAAAALLPVYAVGAQDNSRLCLSQALAHGRVSNDGCFGLDRAERGGHVYSDKAPGLSLVELPLAEALGLPAAQTLHGHPWRLWLVRVLAVGLPFVLLAFLVGRVSEGLAPGYGAPALVTFALGTLVAPFAAANFDAVPAAALGFGAFLLAWRGNALAAGLAAGATVLVQYQAAIVLVLLAAYLLTRHGFLRYAAGVVPGVLVLAAYDWWAFGAPWRLSYRYVANAYASEQARGLFGIGLPHRYGSYEVFAGTGGLLVISPVLLAAAWGLVLLGRSHRKEALLCGAVTALFLFANCGYFLPYGGSPGPRFLIPALPFLALGLGPAFEWRPRLTAALALVSVVATTALLLVWSNADTLHGGIWRALAQLPAHGSSARFAQALEATVAGWAGAGRIGGAVLVVLLALAAFGVAFAGLPRALPRRGLVVAVAGIAVLALAQASTVFGYPYGTRSDLSLSIDASRAAALPPQEVDFTIVAGNSSRELGYGHVVLRIQLAPGMRLLGRPAVDRGPGCSGTTSLTCVLESLPPQTTSAVRLGVAITQFGDQTLSGVLSADGAPSRRASFTVGTS